MSMSKIDYNNDECYVIKDRYYDTGIFDNSLDCTYVILCCGTNPYREQVCLSQLDILQPTKHVKLVYNYGYIDCEKHLDKQTTVYDLRDALMYIFKDSLVYPGRILVLEDDFEIDVQVLVDDKSHVRNINNFLKSHSPDVYGLGNVCVIHPFYLHQTHQKALFMYAAHSIIYGNNYRNMILLQYYSSNKKKLAEHIDMIWNMFRDVSIYRYHKQLFYQKHNETDNMKNWPVPFWLAVTYINLFKLRNNARIGYRNLNIFNYIISILFILLSILFLIMSIKYTSNTLCKY